MIKQQGLTHAFLSKHPESAARVLENLTVSEVAALFAELPARLIAPVIRNITPNMVALVLMQLETDQQVSLVKELNPRIAANVMRNWVPQHRRQVFKFLPTYMATRIRILLDYAPDSVGSIMNTEIITANINQTVGDVESAVRNVKMDHQCDVYVLDEALRFRGAVGILKLLREDNNKKLRQIMDKTMPTISATASISSVSDHIGWESHVTLPVVDRNRHVVGTFQQALSFTRQDYFESVDTGTGYLAADILDVYWTAWKSILGAVLIKDNR